MGLMVEAGVGRFIDRLAAFGHQESSGPQQWMCVQG